MNDLTPEERNFIKDAIIIEIKNKKTVFSIAGLRKLMGRLDPTNTDIITTLYEKQFIEYCRWKTIDFPSLAIVNPNVKDIIFNTCDNGKTKIITSSDVKELEFIFL